MPPSRLALWSFAVAIAHGAGLMLVPIYLGLCRSFDMDQGHQAAAALIDANLGMARQLGDIDELLADLFIHIGEQRLIGVQHGRNPHLAARRYAPGGGSDAFPAFAFQGCSLKSPSITRARPIADARG